MVVKILKEPRDQEHDRRPLTVGEFRRVIKEIIAAMLVFGAAMTLALGLSWVAVERTNTQARQANESRELGRRTTCAINNAIIDAGLQQLDASVQPGPKGFVRNLERIGLPPLSVRRQGIDFAKAQYGGKIGHAVETATGRKGLVRSNGTLRCELFSRALGSPVK